MLNFSIRVADPAADYERIAELISLAEPEPITADTIHEWDKRMSPGKIRRRAVATLPNGRIIGYSLVLHESWMPEGRFLVWMIIDPEERQHGIGATFYDEALQFALDSGAEVIESEVQESNTEALRFAERLGYGVERHVFSSRLNLAIFDDSQFDGLLERIEGQGIRFTTLLAEGDTEAARRKLHALNTQIAIDDPANTSGSFSNFEEFNQTISTASWFNPAGQILAVDGERYVGLAAVGFYERTNSMHNMITGVDREYRGRGIAQALKLLAIYYAKAMGADYITTNNDSQNAPMQAVNHKMGYLPHSGIYRLLYKLP